MQRPLLHNDPIHELGGKFSRETVQLFYEDSSPPGQGLGRIPTPDPTWHRF